MEKSFSAKLKEEIINEQVKNACCRRALLSGALAAKGYVKDGAIELSVDIEGFYDWFSGLATEIYSTTPTRSVKAAGGRGKSYILRSHSAVKYITNITNDITIPELARLKCPSCRSAFLRGVFLASGRASDPSRQYSLEFSLGERTELFKRVLDELDIPPSVAKRSGGSVLYYRSASRIEDFFANAGMNAAVFSIINAMINNESRNNANRISNCETNNIGKSVDASRKYINAITDLSDANLLSSLPDELERTARLRLEYSDLSLLQLSKVAVPPISKSGLCHRLNKILDIARAKLGKTYE